MQNGALTGSKRFVYDAHGADVFIEAAMDGLYLVEPGHGVTLTTRRLADMRSHADVESNADQTQKFSEGCEDLLGRVLDQARILTACEMLGMARQGFDTTLTCLKQRVQLIQVLATFQALQHRMADFFYRTRPNAQRGRGRISGTRQRGWLRTRRNPRQGRSKPRSATGKQGRHSTAWRHGLTDEHDVGFYLKRARVLEDSLGSTSFMRDCYVT